MPTARWYLDTAVVDGMIYAVGGTKAGWVNLSTVELYDPVSDTWEKKADMPTARRTPALAAVNGRIYAIGGVDSVRVLETVEEYTPEGWSVHPQLKLTTTWGSVKHSR